MCRGVAGGSHLHSLRLSIISSELGITARATNFPAKEYRRLSRECAVFNVHTLSRMPLGLILFCCFIADYKNVSSLFSAFSDV